jgi:hypothetical protein
MAISAVRQKSLDQQTNVAIVDMITANTSDILNSPNIGSDNITAQVQAFFDSAKQADTVTAAQAVDSTVRAAKNAMGKVRDIGKLSTKDIDKLVSGLLKDKPKAQAVFNKLAPKCQTKGLGTGSIGKRYDTDIDCGGKKRKGNKDGCTSSEYSDVLNKLTDGAYAANHKDLNSALQNLVSLSKFGYDMNLCGVFSALVGDLNKDVLSRGSGAIMSYLASSGNVLGMFDISGAAAGLHSTVENPGIIKDFFANFKMPSEVKGTSLTDIAVRSKAAMELVDENWNMSQYDGMLSVGFADGYNGEVDEVLRAEQLGYSFNDSQLDIPVATDDTYMMAAYNMNSFDAMAAFA